MDYKEKYEKALVHLKKFLDGDCVVDQEILADFPELAESEDERIRKDIVASVEMRGDLTQGRKSEIYTYLEKQKEQKPLSTEEWELNSLAFLEQMGYTCIPHGAEQKPVGWSEEDEHRRTDAIYFLETAKIHYADVSELEATISWLKSLCSRVSKESLQTWSEEDDITNGWEGEDLNRYISCLQRLGTGNPRQPETINSVWFKQHVFPQPHWKPSEEQMNILLKAEGALRREHYEAIANKLAKFYEQLKKLSL